MGQEKTTDGNDVSLGAKILLADDSHNHCRIIRHVLEADGFRVAEAHTGELALEVFSSWRPDLVILDSMLPQKSGIQCLHLMKHHPRLSHVPVVMCSANVDIMYALQCMDAGAGAFIAKPFKNQTLLKRVQHILSSGPTGHISECET